MKKLLLLAGAALLMSACAESSTAPTQRQMVPSNKSSHDLTCRSGYVVAYDSAGNPYCAPDSSTTTTSTTTSTATSRP